MKVHLRLDSGEDADPASRPPLGDVISAAGEVFSRALEELLPEGTLPKEVEISVTLLSLDEIKDQNALHRGIDEPTDVLSFPLWEEAGVFRPAKGLPVLPLGDVVICPEYLRKNLPQGPSSEKAFLEEMALMLAHGFLHLLAWDHDTKEDRETMEAAQEKIRADLLSAAREREGLPL